MLTVLKRIKLPAAVLLIIMVNVIINAHYREIQETIHKGISSLYEVNEDIADFLYEANDFVLNGRSFDQERKEKNAIYSSFDSVVMVSTTQPGSTRGGIGTGWFVDVTGDVATIITNYHVISSANGIDANISVTTPMEMWTYDVEVVGWDEIADIAVLRIKKKDKEEWKAFDVEVESEIAMGDPVVVMGHGMSMPYTATQGVVSYANRYGFRPYSLMLQIDAVINQGNSGGPVIGMNGKVYGVAQSILSPGRGVPGWDGVGLAVSARQTLRSYEYIISPQYKSKGYVPYAEFPMQLSIKELADVFDIDKKDRHYAYIDYSNQNPETPKTVGELAGLQQGDVILEIDGEKVTSSFAVLKKTIYSFPGDVWNVKVKRGEEIVEIQVAMREMDRQQLLQSTQRRAR